MNEYGIYPSSAYANLTIKESVLKIVEEFYEADPDADPPRQDEIVSRLSRIKKDLAGANSKYTYKLSNLQPQASRYLKILSNEKKIIKKEGSGYVPYDIKFKRKPIADKIKKEVIFTSPTLFKMNSYSVLIHVDPRSLYTAKILFKEYLEEDCFDVLQFDGYVLILLPQKYADDMESDELDSTTLKQLIKKERLDNKEIRKILRKLVEECYTAQQIKPVTMHKLVQRKPEK